MLVESEGNCVTLNLLLGTILKIKRVNLVDGAIVLLDYYKMEGEMREGAVTRRGVEHIGLPG